jgi:ADP-ribosyl-[dinitrogen reductase] hydrolase
MRYEEGRELPQDRLFGMNTMNNAKTRTSDTHPFRIDSVQPGSAWGLIGMSFCPGKKQLGARTGNWDRDLATDLAQIKAWGASMVVSLVELPEFDELQVPTLPREVEGLGIKWRHLPIRDMHQPGTRFQRIWPELSQEIVAALGKGQRVFVHCKGGLGRTGTVVACLLIESGIPPAEAITKVRTARRSTIETWAQEEFVLGYKPVCFVGEQA